MTPRTEETTLLAPPSVTNKASLRRLLRMQRQTLSEERQKEAALSAKEAVLSQVAERKKVLSYSSINEELDTRALNAQLAQEGRLVLPRVNGEGLRLYEVSDPETQLVAGTWDLLEPDPALCPETTTTSVDAVIVPGVAFDLHKNRLGYGKGFYDRLLSEIPETTITIGLAYREQCVAYVFPVEDHDVPMDTIITA